MVSIPLVSIVIPTYNGGSFLIESLKSALAQDYPNTEIIVVDDGSSVDISELIRPFADRLTLISQKNLGPGAARNRGAKESRGEFIAFLDHDDLWTPNKISVQAAILNKNPDCGLVYCLPKIIDQNGDAVSITPPTIFPEGKVFEDFLTRNRITSFSATLVRRSSFFAVGGIDESLEIITCDDYDLWLRLSARFEVAFSRGDLVYYRVHPGNFVKNRLLNMDAHVRVVEKCRRSIRAEKHLAEHFDHEKAIKNNLFRTYRGFGFIFYYDFPESNLNARHALKKAIQLSPGNLKCIIHYLLTFQPLMLLRKAKRLLLRNRETAPGLSTNSSTSYLDLPECLVNRNQLADIRKRSEKMSK